MLNKKNIVVVFVLFLFCFTCAAIYSYHRNVIKYKELIVPTQDVGSFTTAHYYRNDDVSRTLSLNLSPGDIYEGKYYTKNHYLTDESFKSSFLPFKRFDTLLNDYTEDDEEYFFIEPKEVVYSVSGADYVVNSYVLKIPDDIDLGNYRGMIKSMLNSNTHDGINSDGITFKIAYKSLIDLNIVNEKSENVLIENMSDYKTLALNDTLYFLRFCFSVFFAIISLIVLIYTFFHQK